jgi:hypothetical protein
VWVLKSALLEILTWTLEADGSITAWGGTNNEGTGAPSDSGYTKIYSTQYAFAALKADGSITAWGYSYWGGTTGAPSDNGYTKIYSNAYAGIAIIRGRTPSSRSTPHRD